MAVIATDKAPAAIGPYSQAITANGFVYLSGQLGLVPETGKLAEGGTLEQAKRIFRNIAAVLDAAGSKPENVVKTTCFLTDLGDFAAFNALYAEFFTGKPARSCVEVSKLPLGGSVEVEVIATI
ncbi:MAG: RidA family protein [Oscillospiraceae bacterium]|jgi:2-iminobutanoate/2-iminopropanoate deaminase|nr:RidA family protein [Oscillospiraceae bacterium]